MGSIVSLAVVGLGSMAWMADNSAPPLDARHEVLDEAAEDSWRGNNVDANLIKGKTHRLYLAGGRTADAPEPALATSVPNAPHGQTPDPQAPSGSRFRPNMVKREAQPKCCPPAPPLFFSFLIMLGGII